MGKDEEIVRLSNAGTALTAKYADKMEMTKKLEKRVSYLENLVDHLNSELKKDQDFILEISNEYEEFKSAAHNIDNASVSMNQVDLERERSATAHTLASKDELIARMKVTIEELQGGNQADNQEIMALREKLDSSEALCKSQSHNLDSKIGITPAITFYGVRYFLNK